MTSTEVSVSLNEKMTDKVQIAMKAGCYRSMQHFIREAVREKLSTDGFPPGSSNGKEGSQ